MSAINDYRDLKVWQVSMSFAEDVYKLAGSLPVEERFALADQLRRAVVSIPFCRRLKRGKKEILNKKLRTRN